MNHMVQNNGKYIEVFVWKFRALLAQQESLQHTVYQIYYNYNPSAQRQSGMSRDSPGAWKGL